MALQLRLSFDMRGVATECGCAMAFWAWLLLACGCSLRPLCIGIAACLGRFENTALPHLSVKVGLCPKLRLLGIRHFSLAVPPLMM